MSQPKPPPRPPRPTPSLIRKRSTAQPPGTVIGAVHCLEARNHNSGSDVDTKFVADDTLADLRKLEVSIDVLAGWREK